MPKLSGSELGGSAHRLQQQLERALKSMFGDAGYVKDLFDGMKDVNLRGTEEGRVLECKYYSR